VYIIIVCVVTQKECRKQCHVIMIAYNILFYGQVGWSRARPEIFWRIGKICVGINYVIIVIIISQWWFVCTTFYFSWSCDKIKNICAYHYPPTPNFIHLKKTQKNIVYNNNYGHYNMLISPLIHLWYIYDTVWYQDQRTLTGSCTHSSASLHRYLHYETIL